MFDPYIVVTEIYLDEESVRKERDRYINYRDIDTFVSKQIKLVDGTKIQVKEYADEINRKRLDKLDSDPEGEGLPGNGDATEN